MDPKKYGSLQAAKKDSSLLKATETYSAHEPWILNNC